MPAGHPPFWIHVVALHGTGLLLAVLIVAWLALAEPLLGRRAFRGFLRALDRGNQAARARFYRLWIVQSWVLMALLLLIAFYGFGWTPALIGLQAPRVNTHVPWTFLAGFAIALFAGAILGAVLARRRRKTSLAGRPKPASARPAADVLKMLPRTPAERGWFAALAITAGITEEVVWRGILLAVLLAVFPGLPMSLQVSILGVVFGWAHLYQGARGMLGAGIMGFVLGALYLATGSLLLPIVVHVLVDLAAMLQAPSKPANAASGSSGT